ncbi:HK97 family phage prohead protease [Sphingomonas sp. SORGH_AS870]|uniref:HK97 family phage prohead protease n=1 Tax=Sphingomonas sp. SORGH_AS_0870 TaxID=3041801 RepID=UPI00285A0688|nr:HK97 family phage prohead protease [Sphingomonas sp. SORGH_AS_0870]MDR6146140.1 HK97 family phage prohead protease [Sphingomonas sp. SORGH_AS_0870]
MEKKAFAGKIEVKFAETEGATARTFEGYGAVFNNVDQARDIIAPGAFSATLEEHKSAGTMPAMFFNHDAFALPIGVWTDLIEDSTGLKASGQFLDTTAGRDAYAAVKAGAVTGLSIGYIATGYEIDGKTRTITEAKLIEISVVTFPCNELARVASVKNQENDMDEDLKKKLTDAGFGEDAITKLFDSRDDDTTDDEVMDDDDEKSGDVDEDAGDEQEAKYHEAALAAIRSSVATIKEMYVR